MLLLQAARCVPEGKTKVAPQSQGDPLQREGLPSVLGPSRRALPGQLGATRRAQLLRRRRVVLLHEGRAGMMVRLRPSLQPLHVASRWAAARALKRTARARRRELSLKFAQSLNFEQCLLHLFICLHNVCFDCRKLTKCLQMVSINRKKVCQKFIRQVQKFA